MLIEYYESISGCDCGKDEDEESSGSNYKLPAPSILSSAFLIEFTLFLTSILLYEQTHQSIGSKGWA